MSTETDPVAAARMAGSDERPNKRLKKPTAVFRAGHQGAMRQLLLFWIQSLSYARVPRQASCTWRAALFSADGGEGVELIRPGRGPSGGRMP